MAMLNIIRKIRGVLQSSYWNIGFVEEDIKEVLNSDHLHIHWLHHPYKDRWFADPFFLRVDDTHIVLLAEEFCYASKKGRIAKLVIKREGYLLEEMKIILELPSHLSFPFIFRKDDDILMIPESSKSGQTTVYAYDEQTDEVKEVSVLCHLPLTDAILFKMADDRHYILSTKEPTQNKNHLQVYSVDPDKWKMDEQPIQDISFESNIARNAGDVFTCDGIMYRPAQDCNKGYGNGVVIQRMSYANGQFLMKDVRTFFSDIPTFDMGYHTFNNMNGLIVVDAHGHRYQMANQVVTILLKLYRLVVKGGKTAKK